MASTMMDDAELTAMLAEMEDMRRRQQQQSWELQAKLGTISAAELNSMATNASRPIAGASSPQSAMPTMVPRPELAATGLGAPPVRTGAAPPRPSGHVQLRSSMLGGAARTI